MTEWRYRLYEAKTKAWSGAARMLPERLKYWVLIDASRHIQPHEEVPRVPFTVVVDRAGKQLNERHR